ncbi:MAG: PilZ domain-containing protein [Candidatus Aminicenantales bacterium]
MLHSDTIQDVFKTIKKEQGFKLPLSTRVKGKNAFGEDFVEKTEFSYISHRGGSFWLKTPILFGTELELVADLPVTLSQKKLKLHLTGKIVFIEALKGQNFCQRVTVKFNRKFKISPAQKE